MLSWVQHQASCGVTGSRLGTQSRISGKKVFKAGARKDLFPFGDTLKINPLLFSGTYFLQALAQKDVCMFEECHDHEGKCTITHFHLQRASENIHRIFT